MCITLNDYIYIVYYGKKKAILKKMKNKELEEKLNKINDELFFVVTC